jgi:4-hydroxybenzoate polyprenyltransferase
MKTALRLSFPMLVAIAFLTFTLQLFSPTPLMSCFIILSMVIALLAACYAYSKLRLRFDKRFSLRVSNVVIFSIVMFLVFIALLACFEEFYIHFFTVPSSDMPGMQRYIYPGNSGMGFADGFRLLPKNMLEMTILGGSVGLLWGLIWTGIEVFTERKKAGLTSASSQRATARG